MCKIQKNGRNIRLPVIPEMTSVIFFMFSFSRLLLIVNIRRSGNYFFTQIRVMPSVLHIISRAFLQTIKSFLKTRYLRVA